MMKLNILVAEKQADGRWVKAAVVRRATKRAATIKVGLKLDCGNILGGVRVDCLNAIEFLFDDPAAKSVIAPRFRVDVF